jgi:REP element-mobilizing transposase RayT
MASYIPSNVRNKERTMPQSLAKVIVHIVFSTKNRTPWLRDVDLRKELYAYQGTILKKIDSPALLINGVEDHIHILCLLSRKVAIMDLVQEVKTETSKWLKTRTPSCRDFHWQGGYAVFSVSESKIEEVKRYIANQEAHHRRMSFQDEFREMCKRHGMDLDERYAWD